MGKLLRILFAAVLLLIVVAIVAFAAIDLLVKAGLEGGATYALGVETTVDDVSVSIMRGELGIEGLRISNPSGFSSDHLMHSGQFELKMRAASVFTETIELEKFELDGLDVNIEQQVSGSNVAKLIDNLERFGGGEGKRETPEKEGKKVRIDRIAIRNVVGHFHLLPDVAPGGSVTVQIPEIVLTDVTSDAAEGITIAELVRRLVPAILAAIITESAAAVPGEFLNDLDTPLAGLTEKLGGQIQKLTEQVQTTLETDTGKTVTGVLESILGGEEKPEEN